MIFKGRTGGWFSALQSAGATVVVSPLPTLLGLGLVVAGIWFGRSWYFVWPRLRHILVAAGIWLGRGRDFVWSRLKFCLVEAGIWFGASSRDKEERAAEVA